MSADGLAPLCAKTSGGRTMTLFDRTVKTEDRPNLPSFRKRQFQMNFRKMNITFLSVQLTFSVDDSVRTGVQSYLNQWRRSSLMYICVTRLSLIWTTSNAYCFWGSTLEPLIWPQHCYGNAIFMKFSSLATLEVVKMTTSITTNDGYFVKMTTVPFLWTLGMVDNRSLQKCKHQR